MFNNNIEECKLLCSLYTCYVKYILNKSDGSGRLQTYSFPI